MLLTVVFWNVRVMRLLRPETVTSRTKADMIGPPISNPAKELAASELGRGWKKVSPENTEKPNLLSPLVMLRSSKRELGREREATASFGTVVPTVVCTVFESKLSLALVLKVRP